MESHGENVAEVKHDQRVNRIQRHADQERPLLAFAGKIPEDYEDARHESIDDEVDGTPLSPNPGLDIDPPEQVGVAWGSS